jgi:hypothetical protein
MNNFFNSLDELAMISISCWVSIAIFFSIAININGEDDFGVILSEVLFLYI